MLYDAIIIGCGLNGMIKYLSLTNLGLKCCIIELKKNIEDTYPFLVEYSLMKVMIIPDICSVEFGRGVGYDIIEHIPPTEIGEVSATKIREQLRKEGKL